MIDNIPPPRQPTEGQPQRRFFAYYRTATGSIQVRHQQLECERLVVRLDGTIAGYAADVGSGLRMSDLPGYLRLLGAVTARDVHAVVASDLSRFGRDLRELAQLFELCDQNGVEIWDARIGRLAAHHILQPGSSPLRRLPQSYRPNSSDHEDSNG